MVSTNIQPIKYKYRSLGVEGHNTIEEEKIMKKFLIV